MLQPSPTAGPLTAAMIGSLHRIIPVTIWRPWVSDVWRRAASLASSSM